MKRLLLAAVALTLSLSSQAATITPDTIFNLAPGADLTFSTNVNNGKIQYFGLEVGSSDLIGSAVASKAVPANTVQDVFYAYTTTDAVAAAADVNSISWLASSLENLTMLLAAGTNYILRISGTGSQVTTQISVSAVPLPTALWLFGSALVGFVAVSNRRRV